MPSGSKNLPAGTWEAVSTASANPDAKTGMPMSSTPEAHWIEAAVDQYEGQLIRYAARIIGDVERARDVVQDGFMKLCRQDRARIEGHLAEWLFTVCRNGALDVRRKETRMKPSPDLGSTAVADPAADPFADPGRGLEQREAHARILRLMGSLPESQQEVLRLKFQNGLSYREIAEITRRTVNHVGVLIHNGVKALRAKAAVSHPAPAAGRSQP